MDALAELAELVQRRSEGLPCFLDDPTHGLGVRGQLRLGEPERHRDGDEPLLRAVVQVALEPPPFRIGGVDHPRTRDSKLFEPRAQVGLQTFVLEREPGGGTDGVDEIGLILERRIVNEGGDGATFAFDDRRHSRAAVGG